jgi:hypothetical protein
VVHGAQQGDDHAGIYTHLFNADDHARATAPRKSSPSPTVWAAGRQ